MRPTVPAWSYSNPTRIVYDDDGLAALAAEIDCDRALLLVGAGFAARSWAAEIIEILGSRIGATIVAPTPNPTIGALAELAEDAMGVACDAILAVGGGSVIDSGKVLSVIRDDWVGDAQAFHDALAEGSAAYDLHVRTPLIAVPTTAGTGAEVTPFATIWDKAGGRKYSLDAPALAPRLAIVSPMWTMELPLVQTASTGVDAVSQGLESLWSRRANPMSTALAVQSLAHSLSALPSLLNGDSSLAVRRTMSVGSTLSGLAIAQTRTGIVHSMSYPITARLGVPHGFACGFTLMAALEFNLQHDQARLLPVAAALGLSDVLEAVDVIRDVVERSGSYRQTFSRAGSAAAILAVADSLVTPGRWDTNYVPIDELSVARLLASSVARAERDIGRV